MEPMDRVIPIGSPAPREGTYTPIGRDGRPLEVAISVNQGDRLPPVVVADAGVPLGYMRIGESDPYALAA